MIRPLQLLTPLLGAMALAACSSAPEEPAAGTGATAFEGARVIVGDGSTIENATILVRDGRIEQVAAGLDVPAGAERVDLAGKTVMPAIIDTHAHTSQTRDDLVNDLQRRAYYGVAAVVSLGQDTGEAPFQIRQEELPNAARLLTAGRGITRPEPGRSDAPYWISTADEARAAVRELADKQVDIVKIWVDDRNGQYPKLTPELYQAVIDEAHMRGLRVTAHIFTLEDAKGLLRAGVDAFAHGIRDRDVDDEVIALFKERPDVVVVPNLPDPGVAADYGWLRGTLPDGEVDKLQAAATDRPEAQQSFGIQARNLAALHKAGVKIALGTDGNTPWAAHAEMADMVRAGMPAGDVLVAATRNGAELLRLQNLGTIEAGNSADFLVLDANPIDDIANTRTIDRVYLRGEAVDREMIRAGWQPATSD